MEMKSLQEEWETLLQDAKLMKEGSHAHLLEKLTEATLSVDLQPSYCSENRISSI